MVKLNSLLVVAALALTTAACGTTDNGSDQPPPVTNSVATTDAPDVQQAQAPADEAQETALEQRAEELPATASPLALAGLLGVLSVVGVLVTRFLGRL
jgi:hypothetical protein